MKVKENELQQEQVITATDEKETKDVMNVPIKRPVEINGVLLTSIKLDFTKLTGDTVLRVDEELRAEGFPTGFDNIWNQQAILKLAARAAGMLTEDLRKLHAGDFMEVTFRTRNFFIGW